MATRIEKYIIHVLMLVSFTSFSQETDLANEKYHLGYNGEIGTRITAEGYWHNLGSTNSMMLTFSKSKHQFAIGPQLMLSENRYNQKFGLFGYYKFFPNGYETKFSTYFQIGLPINYAKDKMEVIYSDVPAIVSNPKEENVISVMGQFGYGVNYQFGKKKRLNFGTSIAFNLGYMHRNWVYVPLSEGSDQKYHSNYIISCVTLGVNVGYKF